MGHNSLDQWKADGYDQERFYRKYDILHDCVEGSDVQWRSGEPGSYDQAATMAGTYLYTKSTLSLSLSLSIYDGFR